MVFKFSHSIQDCDNFLIEMVLSTLKEYIDKSIGRCGIDKKVSKYLFDFKKSC